MMRWVPHGHIGGDADQLFGLAVEQGLMAMLGLPPVVAPLEGLQVHLGQEVMVAHPEAAYAGDPFLLRLLVSLCRHTSTSLRSCMGRVPHRPCCHASQRAHRCSFSRR